MSETNRFLRSSRPYHYVDVRCIYSGNTHRYVVTERRQNEKEYYTNKFMKEQCPCRSCSIERADREKLIKALREQGDKRALALLGVKDS